MYVGRITTQRFCMYSKCDSKWNVGGISVRVERDREMEKQMGYHLTGYYTDVTFNFQNITLTRVYISPILNVQKDLDR